MYVCIVQERIYTYINTYVLQNENLYLFQNDRVNGCRIYIYTDTEIHLGYRERRYRARAKKKELQENVDFARTIMQTVGAKRYFLSLAFSFRKISAKTFARKTRALRHSRYARRRSSLSNRIGSRGSGESSRARRVGN